MNRLFSLAVLVTVAPSALAAYPPPGQVKAAFLKLLDRPRVPLDPETVATKPMGDGFVLEHVRFTSEKKPDGRSERVPVYLVRPTAAKKLPAVIVLHGTGGSGKSQVAQLVEFAKRGMIGVAIDARYHGERAGGAKGAAAYNQAIVRAWRSKPGAKHEHPFYYDTCWDLWRLVDYLETRRDIDAKNLGMIGFSMGGIEAWLAAAVDDRIKVTVPAIGVQSFRWSLENERWHGRANTIRAAHEVAAADLGQSKVNQQVCRALWQKVDCPSMLRLFAGRPLLILNGEKDGNCPLPGAKIAFAGAEKAFQEAGASDKLRIMVAEGVGHRVTPEQRAAAFDWFARWLK
jgi:dienelactone hydrolase